MGLRVGTVAKHVHLRVELVQLFCGHKECVHNQKDLLGAKKSKALEACQRRAVVLREAPLGFFNGLGHVCMDRDLETIAQFAYLGPQSVADRVGCMGAESGCDALVEPL